MNGKVSYTRVQKMNGKVRHTNTRVQKMSGKVSHTNARI